MDIPHKNIFLLQISNVSIDKKRKNVNPMKTSPKYMYMYMYTGAGVNGKCVL